jgi:dTDP-4-dehydrorhamnose 3,5-epimerase
MKVSQTDLPGVLLIEPDVYRDARGWFIETWRRDRYRDTGLPDGFVQDNLSYSKQGVLRGLHYQHPQAQGKLVSVLDGVVFDVTVDVRRGSPTFGRWVGVEISADNHRQLYIPPGFAHGFCVTGTHALFAYKCTAAYDAGGEVTLRWDDPDLAIAWPVSQPVVSGKDAAGMRLSEVPAAQLPVFDGSDA